MIKQSINCIRFFYYETKYYRMNKNYYDEISEKSYLINFVVYIILFSVLRSVLIITIRQTIREGLIGKDECLINLISF